MSEDDLLAALLGSARVCAAARALLDATHPSALGEEARLTADEREALDALGARALAAVSGHPLAADLSIGPGAGGGWLLTIRDDAGTAVVDVPVTQLAEETSHGR